MLYIGVMNCAYGCGGEAKHAFKNGVMCCSPHRTKCPAIKARTSWSKGVRLSEAHRAALSRAAKGNPRVVEAAKLGGAVRSRSVRVPTEDYLVCDRSVTTSRLRDRLIADGLLPNQCALCGLGPRWNDKPLRLQLDHIDGNKRNNQLVNLRIVCPNCHTQTETYAAKNRVLIKSRRASG